MATKVALTPESLRRGVSDMSRFQRIATLIELYAILLGCLAAIGYVGYRARPQISSTIATMFASKAVPAYGEASAIFFFMPDCPACHQATPAVEELARRYPKQVARVDSS